MLAVTEGQSTRACDQNTSDGGSVRRTWYTRVIRFAFMFSIHSYWKSKRMLASARAKHALSTG